MGTRRTFSDGKKIYSVDMMFAYVNLFKPEVKMIDINKLSNVLTFKSWGDPAKKIYYSPLDVIEKYKSKKYKHDFDRIKSADLKYPIIITDKFVIDGVHRLTKAFLSNKKKIKAYVFPDALLEKFLISKTGNWAKVDKLQMHDFIELFYERFTR